MSESPQSEQRPSGRKGSRKVRTGCITCKVRKVKCDEAKPACLRCLKSGRKCDGYQYSSTSRSQALFRHLSPTIEFESPNGRRAFDYYHARLIPVLGGIYTSEFWGETVLQLSLTEPVVHHSLLSLSSFLECELAKDGTDHARKSGFAFSEYAKAISAMRNWRSNDGYMAVPLLVCVLFTCIEFLLDRSQASQLHICQGRKLLSQLEDIESSAIDMVKRDLVPIYARLSLASFLFGARPEAIPDKLRSSTATPVEFKTLRDAKNRLYHLLDDALRFTTQAKPAAYATPPNHLELAALEAIQQSLLNQLSDWNNSFTMLATNLAQNTSLRISQNLLQIYYHAAVIWICTALQPSELAYDNHIAAFASIISLASAVVNQTNASKKLPDFSFETELIAPLYWTATKCRHPTLRRAALRLLLKDELRNRKENLWHARETIIIASRIIEMEEQGLDTTAAETKAAHESPEQEFTPSTQISSDSTSSQWNDNDLHVPLSKPPTLPPPAVTLDTATVAFDSAIEGEGEASFNRPVVQNGVAIPEHLWLKSAAHMASSLPVHISVSPPFDIPETMRVKNTLIGPRQPGGIWITVFRDLNSGQQKWDITKEFLAV